MNQNATPHNQGDYGLLSQNLNVNQNTNVNPFSLGFVPFNAANNMQSQLFGGDVGGAMQGIKQFDSSNPFSIQHQPNTPTNQISLFGESNDMGAGSVNQAGAAQRKNNKAKNKQRIYPWVICEFEFNFINVYY